MNVAAFAAVIALLGVNAVFVAFEFALVVSRRARLEQMAAIRGRRYRRALVAVGHLADSIAGVQLGVTMASLGLGAVAEPPIGHVLRNALGLGRVLPHSVVTGAAYVLAFIFVAYLHSVFGELVPKNLAISDAERVLALLAQPVGVFIAVFRPVVRALDAVAGLGLRMAGVRRQHELVSAHTPDELELLFDQSREGGLLGEGQHQRLSDAIDFAGLPIRDVMVPRSRIVATPLGTTIEDAERLLVESGHSRLPIYALDLDHVLGFVHAKDLLALGTDSGRRPLPVSSIRQMLVVHDSRPLPEVLVAMRRSRLHVALVVDGDGHTAGLATLEDLLEELVGEITDETDRSVL